VNPRQLRERLPEVLPRRPPDPLTTRLRRALRATGWRARPSPWWPQRFTWRSSYEATAGPSCR